MKNILTIPKSLTGNEELIIMSREQYERIMSNSIPSFYLKGKGARFVDNRVNRGLKEYKEKKVIKANSLVDALILLKNKANA